MPTYIYKNPKREEYIEVIQSMNDEHEFVDDSGAEWERVFSSPKVSISTNNDGSKESFMSATHKKCDLGDLWDASAAASEKREKTYGKDSVKDKFHSDYGKKTNGKKILSKIDI